MTPIKRVALFFTFLAGIILGGLGLFPFSGLNDHSENSSVKEGKTSRAPELKPTKSPQFSSLPLPTENNTNNLLLQYTGLSLQETRDELQRLLAHEQNKEQTFGHLSIQYLMYKLGAMSPDDAKQILQEKIKEDDFRPYISYLLEGWAQTDIKGAMDFLLTHKREWEGSPESFHRLVKEWAEKEPDKVLQWFQTLRKGERVKALIGIAEGIPLGNPRKMAEFISGLAPAELEFSKQESFVASTWVDADWDAFKAWTETLPHKQKETMSCLGFYRLGKTNPEKAAEELKKYPREYSSDIIARSVINGINQAENNGGLAFDWLIKYREYISDVPKLMEGTISDDDDYYLTPPFTRKILAMPEGAIKDAALKKLLTLKSRELEYNSRYGKPVDTTFPQLMEMNRNISDPYERYDSSLNCADSWISAAPEEARLWIRDHSSFSESHKQELFRQCDKQLQNLKEEEP